MSNAHGHTPPGGAGGRAQREADKRRRRARQLEAEAAKWEAGAEGERRTAAVLASLPTGWLVAHDAGIPGSRANLDHVVIGPAGTFLVDSKNLGTDHPIRPLAGTLFRGRYPMRRELETLQWEARQAAATLQRPVQPVMCFVNDNLGTAPIVVDGVHALDLSSLVSWLTAQARHQRAAMAPPPTPARTARAHTTVGRRRSLTRRERVLAVVAVLVGLMLFGTLQQRAGTRVDEAVRLRPITSDPAPATTVRAPTTVARLPAPVVVADYAARVRAKVGR